MVLETRALIRLPDYRNPIKQGGTYEYRLDLTGLIQSEAVRRELTKATKLPLPSYSLYSKAEITPGSTELVWSQDLFPVQRAETTHPATHIDGVWKVLIENSTVQLRAKSLKMVDKEA